MVDRSLLTSDLQKQVKNLEKDLREQVESVEEVRLRPDLTPAIAEFGHDVVKIPIW